jgi:hypothetical protein
LTAGIDAVFVERVRAALAGRIRSITGEVTGGQWTGLQHRDLAERVKALVAARCGAAGEVGDAGLLGYALSLVALLRGRQGAGGLFRGGDNVNSPPDSAFSLNDLADALLMLRGAGDDHPDARRLAATLEDVLAAATPALAKGGVHTPNHRWEVAAALARLHRLAPQPALAERVGQWLAEGVDLEDGLYSERSANYAAHVSNPSLLTVAEVFGRPELVDAVEQNLTATLDLLLPDGAVETVLSRRQDQRWPVPLAGYLLPLRRVALLRGRGDLAWAAGLALAQGVDSPASAAAALLLDPGITAALPAAVAPSPRRRRVFPGAGLLVEHRPAVTAVVFGGSDYPRHGRIRSGLANAPTFLRLFAGAAVLDSVRLSRTFFGLGPFRADGLAVRADPDGRTAALLSETVAAAYYQPLEPADRDAGGRYRFGDEGRFSAAMDFALRARDEVTLATTVRVVLTETGVALTVDVEGAAVDWALELAFRPGGTMSGARALGEGRGWQLDALSTGSAGAATACYRVDADALCVSVLEASDGAGGALPAADAEPAYHPGEEYEFLGGSDAAGGELLYVAAKSPARIRVDIRALPAGRSPGRAGFHD